MQKRLVALLDETPDLGRVNTFQTRLKNKAPSNLPPQLSLERKDYETKQIKATSFGSPNRRASEGKWGDLNAFVQAAFYYRHEGERSLKQK